MARVEIEERAWSDPRLMRLARELKVPEYYAMGLVAQIWHCSQNELAECATAQDLAVWLKVKESRAEILIGVLVGSGYLSPAEGEIQKSGGQLFKIHGSCSRILKVKAYKTRSKLANLKRWGVDDNSGKQEDKQQLTENSPILQGILKDSLRSTAKDSQHDTCNMKHHDSISLTRDIPLLRNGQSDFAPAKGSLHDLKKSSFQLDIADSSCDEAVLSMGASSDAPENHKTPPRIDPAAKAKPRRTPTPEIDSKPHRGVSDLIAHFVACWGKSHPDTAGNPSRYPVAGKDASAAKAIVKAVGRDRAMELVDIYLGFKTAFLSQRRHPLWAMANDLPALIDYAGTGKVITSQGARKIEIGAAGDSVIDRMIARDQEKLRQDKESDEQAIDVESHRVSNADW